MEQTQLRHQLLTGLCIPAHPLALTSSRKLDERRQRALTRYYLAAGAGGLAVAVHTTQFAVRDPAVGLFEPVIALAAEEMGRAAGPLVRIGGVCGVTATAVREAELLRDYGYDAGLVSLSSLPTASDDQLLHHIRAVGRIIPVIGFYLQPAVGGRLLSFRFWRRLAEVDSIVAVKIAPFNRYQTLDVVRAIAASGREDIALYTGNDDNIIADLITPYTTGNRSVRIVGGLLGHWAVWTQKAVELLRRCQTGDGTADLLALGTQVTDSNAAFFDAANGFRGCIAGLHEVLRRQGLLEGIWCLDEQETLSPGQYEEISRVCDQYPHLADDDFVEMHRDKWLSG